MRRHSTRRFQVVHGYRILLSINTRLTQRIEHVGIGGTSGQYLFQPSYRILVVARIQKELPLLLAGVEVMFLFPLF